MCWKWNVTKAEQESLFCKPCHQDTRQHFGMHKGFHRFNSKFHWLFKVKCPQHKHTGRGYQKSSVGALENDRETVSTIKQPCQFIKYFKVREPRTFRSNLAKAETFCRPAFVAALFETCVKRQECLCDEMMLMRLWLGRPKGLCFLQTAAQH